MDNEDNSGKPNSSNRKKKRNHVKTEIKEENSEEPSIQIPIKKSPLIDLRTPKPIRISHREKRSLAGGALNWFKRFFS